ncbi:hypothetical protein Psi02_21590 [Planotetraspora silvatica]|uniref:Phosphotyrosine protein phosphatase I domain-containing protein n=1 Tax=Planotetraspora silvatica TaxID=234614 RepID=A0A8J3UWD0_9ACTN|nr:aquaporin [Planotetraspora silvatica]GII45735.1 hypothetical protein Psi02_21590 [Planotetraspora silvatica]
MSTCEAPSLIRRAFAESLGTGLLVAVVVGSGIMAARLSPDVGVQLLANSAATAAALPVIIVLVGPVSGAHLNPVVSLVDWLLGRRDRVGLTARDVAAYLPAQTIGGIAGTMLANAMFDLPAVSVSTHDRSSLGLWVGEVVATAGLVALVVALPRQGRAHLAPPVIGAYIGAAYWFTSSTSFANPAVTIARGFSDTFAGIAPASIPAFIAAQLVGAALGAVLVTSLHPTRRATDREPVTQNPALPISSHEPSDAPARIHTHLPTLAVRLADDRLRATGQAQGALVSDIPEVLFVCVHNAGRSQMAAALLDHHAQGKVRVRSAGSAPADTINPAVIQVMEELGLDLTKEFPKPLTTEAVQAADVVITMGCGDACPIFPGKRYLDWALDDPAGKPVDQVRPIRDEIDKRVTELLAELVPAH